MTQGRPAEIPAVERMVGPAPRPPEEPDTDGVPWRRLSPAMLAVHPVMETIRFLPVLVGVLFLGANGSGYLWSLIGLGIAIVLGLSRWFTTTYQVTPTHLRVRRGLFRRQAMSVPRDRIRSVDLTAHFLQRLLGLQRMVIGTGRSDRSDQGITLDALSREAAAQLRAELLHNKRPAAPKAATAATTAATTAANTATTTAAPKAVPPATYATPAESLIVALNPRWVRFGPFTLSGLATLGVVGGILSQVFNEADVSPDRFPGLSQVLGQLSALPLPVAVLEVIVTVAVVVAVLSTIGYLFVFWNFTLTRQGDTLHTQRGLISTRATTIEQRRLRGVELSEPLLLRLARGARCLAITTGL
ncbi:MAG TPA: PH domain-containing protein, partial [Pseudonocardiaceae bacterium]